MDNKNDKKLLLVHETLGALGFPDENYELTSYIYARRNEELFSRETLEIMNRELTQDIRSEPRRVQNIRVVERDGEGGISGVGGGGEPEVAILKPLMIKTLTENIQEFQSLCGGEDRQAQLIRFILRLRIETDALVNQQLKQNAHTDMSLYRSHDDEFIVIRQGSWRALQKLGDDGEEARQEYLKSLVSLACELEARHAQP